MRPRRMTTRHQALVNRIIAIAWASLPPTSEPKVTPEPEPKEPEFVYELEAWTQRSSRLRRVTVVAKDFDSATVKACSMLPSTSNREPWEFRILSIAERM